jgi:uncharacterized protein (DUF1015 family)
MPSVYPFRAITPKDLRPNANADLSALLAPPYDVLDAAGKSKLLAQSEDNIVAIDLPHLPAKELGPPSAYQTAADQLARMLARGKLVAHQSHVMFAYRQTFTSTDGNTFRRTGMIATLDVKPFGPAKGGGILPHEQTFSGPKEDRLALMKSTSAQLSPIFGLHADEKKLASKTLADICASKPADAHATSADGTFHEVWIVADAPTISKYQNALASEDVFIADGHHRYTTALNYLSALDTLPKGHPATRCMFVLISMADPGLVIWPTHRVLGGMADYSIKSFLKASASLLHTTEIDADLSEIEASIARAVKRAGKNVLALHDFATKRTFLTTPIYPDPLATIPQLRTKPLAWRTLDVAIVQHLLVEQVCQPKLNAGNPISWAFPHTIKEVQDIGAGAQTGAGGGKGFIPQIAIIVSPTPLRAVKDVSQAGELMPQKSTFFYPKLATGIAINPLA